jgi:hypothetical protein
LLSVPTLTLYPEDVKSREKKHRADEEHRAAVALPP